MFRSIAYFKKELQIAATLLLFRIKDALALRSAFLTQVIGMFLNNISFLIIWIFYFQAFGEINGFGQIEVFGFQGFLSISLGIALFLASSNIELSSLIDSGKLDNLLTQPRNIYFRLLTEKIRTNGFGDIVFGFTLVAIYIFAKPLPIGSAFMWLSLLLPATLIGINVGLVIGLMAFFLPKAKDLVSDFFFGIFVSVGLFPPTSFNPWLKFIFLFILPAILIGGGSLEIILELDWLLYTITWLLAFVWTFAGYNLLNLALKKYESGNLVVGIRG